jgi:hypothetical protein
MGLLAQFFMKNLDALYLQINKHILLAQAYVEITELFFIIKGCRLKPHDYIFKGNKKLVLHRHWIDEYGNSFKITKNKKIEIQYNDLSLDRENLICTDLYYGLSLDRIVKISKSVYICLGFDEDTREECCFLTFLGIDNYLRSYMYLCGEWSIVSPLFLGFKQLCLMARHNDLKNFRHFNNSKTLPIPCLSNESYLSSLPLNTKLCSLLNKKSNLLLSILKNT